MPSVAHQAGGDLAVRSRALDLQRAAVQQMHAAVDVELVALGVAAEVVVVVEDQDPRRAASLARKKYAAASPLMPPPTTTRS